MIGGYGQLAWGRHQCGAQSSEIKPTFHSSAPVDGEVNVVTNRVVEFYIHSFSSLLSPTELAANVEVSEDGGETYAHANTGPYAITVVPYDGQKAWIKVVKSGPWQARSTIIFRVTALDNFGNECVKLEPVEWP